MKDYCYTLGYYMDCDKCERKPQCLIDISVRTLKKKMREYHGGEAPSVIEAELFDWIYSVIDTLAVEREPVETDAIEFIIAKTWNGIFSAEAHKAKQQLEALKARME